VKKLVMDMFPCLWGACCRENRSSVPYRPCLQPNGSAGAAKLETMRAALDNACRPQVPRGGGWMIDDSLAGYFCEAESRFAGGVKLVISCLVRADVPWLLALPAAALAFK
jgi:hypothetical protein